MPESGVPGMKLTPSATTQEIASDTSPGALPWRCLLYGDLGGMRNKKLARSVQPSQRSRNHFSRPRIRIERSSMSGPILDPAVLPRQTAPSKPIAELPDEKPSNGYVGTSGTSHCAYVTALNTGQNDQTKDGPRMRAYSVSQASEPRTGCAMLAGLKRNVAAHEEEAKEKEKKEEQAKEKEEKKVKAT